MSENKGQLLYQTLIYIGKEYKRKFDNDDGTVTKSYSYLFKENESQQFPIRFWGYDTTKGADELVEGDEFVIGFVEKPNPKGDRPIKSARFFGKPDADKQQSQYTSKPQQPTPTEKGDTSHRGTEGGGIPHELNSWASDLLQNAEDFKASFIVAEPYDNAQNIVKFLEWIQSGDAETEYFKDMTGSEQYRAIRDVFVTLCQRMGL